MQHHDPKALHIAKAVQRRERPEIVILFGSRARGDHEELLSDIDVMLVQATEPDDAIQKAAADAAARVARETYGREVPVELVWRTTEEFRHNRRYVNSVETQAVKDGIVMPVIRTSTARHNTKTRTPNTLTTGRATKYSSKEQRHTCQCSKWE